jgi:hypothetical protein
MTWVIALMGFYSCILNFTKIRWKITEILGSKFLAETPCISYFIKCTPMRFPCFKAYFLEVTSHWRIFIKYGIQECIFKMCQNFT